MRTPRRLRQRARIEANIRANERAAMRHQIAKAIQDRANEVFEALDSGAHKHYGATDLGSINPDLATYQAALEEAAMIATAQT